MKTLLFTSLLLATLTVCGSLAHANVNPPAGPIDAAPTRLLCSGADFGEYTAIKIYYTAQGMFLVDGGVSVLYDAYFDRGRDGTLDDFGAATFTKDGLVEVRASMLSFFTRKEQRYLAENYRALFIRVMRAKAEGKCHPF